MRERNEMEYEYGETYLTSFNIGTGVDEIYRAPMIILSLMMNQNQRGDFFKSLKISFGNGVPKGPNLRE